MPRWPINRKNTKCMGNYCLQALPAEAFLSWRDDKIFNGPFQVNDVGLFFFFGYCYFLGHKWSFTWKINDVTQTIWALLKASNCLIWFCLYFGCWKHIGVTKLWNLWLLNFGLLLDFRDVTVTLSQNVLIFCIEYKPIDRTCPFHYQRLELFGLLEEIGIKSSVAYLKYFTIVLVGNTFFVCFEGLWLNQHY